MYTVGPPHPRIPNCGSKILLLIPRLVQSAHAKPRYTEGQLNTYWGGGVDNEYKWTCEVQTCFIQGLAVLWPSLEMNQAAPTIPATWEQDAVLGVGVVMKE